MMKKEPGSVVKVALCMLFVLSLCILPSCKKSEEPTSGPAAADSKAPAPEHPEHPVAAPAAPPTANAGGLVAVDLVLPKPMFVGTPTDTKVLNLEKPLGHARPPFLAPPGTKNVALGKPISGSDEEPIIGELDYITDGDMEAADGSYVELGPLLQHVTIDLEASHEIYGIFVWHYHKQGRVYFDVVVQVADDPDFIENVQTVFNNDIDNTAGNGVGTDKHYVETNEGKLIDVLSKDIKGRYVRLRQAGKLEWPKSVASSFWPRQLLRSRCACRGSTSVRCTVTRRFTPTSSGCCWKIATTSTTPTNITGRRSTT
jgi:hypothetical protein